MTAVREHPQIMQNTTAASMCSGENEAEETIAREKVPKEREAKRGGWAERVVELIERWNASDWRSCGDLVETWSTMPTIQTIMAARRW